MRPTIATLWIFLFAIPATAADQIDFVRDVRPILQKHCYSCHGAQKQNSGLRLDLKSQAFKGGELYGASIVAAKAKQSPLIQFVADEDAELQMPPEGERLSAKEIATLTQWVGAGAAWPDGVDPGELNDPRDHWSFKPCSRPVPPQTRDGSWSRADIDRFILARLETAGLRPSAEADRVDWLRRVTLDLTGLPPTPERVAAFVGDSSETAYERVVDELLNSPRYGERWAQLWLDVVRYADTHGFEVNTERPNAWPYRDYVIHAFNDDKPYDRFIAEQIVGDAMGQDAATGFLVTASVLLPGQIGKDEPSKRLARQDSLDEIVVNIGQTFLGLSVGCARCHDHKFDPISQQDYYSMQAFIAGVEYTDRELVTPELSALRQQTQTNKRRVAEIDNALSRFVPLAQSGAKRSMVNARRNTDRFRPVTTQRLRFTIRSTNNREPCLDELEVFRTDSTNIAPAAKGTLVTSSGNTVAPNRHELRFINDGEYGNSRSWMSSEVGRGWVVLAFPVASEIDRVVWGRDREAQFTDRLPTDYVIEVAADDGSWRIVSDSSDRRTFDSGGDKAKPLSLTGLDADERRQAESLVGERAKLEERITKAATAPKVFAGSFRSPDPIHLLTRGDPEQPREQVAPAIPSALRGPQFPIDMPEQERRRALAGWIASPANPLTARVMVNRIWQGHFGTGLVATPNDFGHSGQPPSHPKLLDWLAIEFVRSGWSVKHLHKLIVLSAVYRQAAQSDPVGSGQKQAGGDTDDRLLWHYPLRRLDAESIRDSMLAVSGQLDLKMFGRGFDLFDKRGGLTGFIPIEHFSGEGLRRMIYAHKVRRERDGVFGAFDCPDAGQSTARRRQSTTPVQALNLLNSPFTLDASNAFAVRLQAEAGSEVARQVVRAYQMALNRTPDAVEIADVIPIVEKYGLTTLCRALFNSNEFLFMP